MRGESFKSSKRAGTLCHVGAALLAIPGTWVCGAAAFAATSDSVVVSSVQVEKPSVMLVSVEELIAEQTLEKSIVISTKRSDNHGTAAAVNVAEMRVSQDTLQPISKVSERVPDLAEPLIIRVAKAPSARISALEPIVAKLAVEPTGEKSSPQESTADAEKSDAKSDTKSESEAKSKSETKSETKPAAKQSVKLTVKAEIEVINFNGITPGISRRIEVLRQWGDPRTDDTQAKELTYRFDGLQAVNVRFEGNLVDSIIVELEKSVLITKLEKKLKLQGIRPAALKNVDGVKVAQVYPERGVMLSFSKQEEGFTIASDDEAETDQAQRIESIVIQPIEAEPFLLRAESNANGNLTHQIADLEAALQMDSSLSDVLVQLSEIHLKLGKAVTAERHAAEAVELNSQNAAYRLQWAKCLRQLARYDLAVKEVRHVLETPGVALLVRAQSLNEMGLLASLGSQKVMQQAMALHSKAIEIADGLAVSDNLEVSRPAKQLLVEAHLAIAVEISLGPWQQKDESVPQWIERASALSEALIDEDKSYLPLRLQVAVSSLAAVANLENPIDPLLWIEEAEETVAEIKSQVSDSLATSQHDWQLGLAYFHGSQIQHRRSKPDSAIHLGELADVQLAELAKQRDEMPDTAYLLGRLYFQIGAVHAVHFDDHVSACEWYDEAVERLLSPVPVTTLAAPQQHGDALVSMGVSYWNQKQHRQAIKVTESGVELIEEAVTSGLLESEVLTVSYGNLSAMYSAEGENESAARYQALAREITSETKSR